MSNKNYTLSSLSVVPKPKSIAASTIDIDNGKMIIEGNNIKDSVSVGDWIVSMTLLDVRRVDYVNNQNSITISHPFNGDSPGEALVVVDKDMAKVLYLELTSSGDTTFNGDGTLFSGVTKGFGQPNLTGSATKFVEPIIVDGSAANVVVDITFHSNMIS